MKSVCHPYFCEFLMAALLVLEASLVIFKSSVLRFKIISNFSFSLLLILFLLCFSVHLFVDVRFVHVFYNNHPLQCWYYKIASLWSHHETSLFVWFCILNSVSFVCLRSTVEHRVAVALFNTAMLFYMLIDCNPFALLDFHELALTGESATQPKGLNPLLYDVNMVWHPPLLYLAQTMLFIPYVKGVIDSDITKPVTRNSFIVFNIAIALGALWAFTQLGWGGFWFWDPVESASLLPLISSLIVLHVPSVWRKQKPWIMAIPFVFVMLSMWLIRSGIFQSVHSFAYSRSQFWMLGLLFLCAAFPVALKMYNQNNRLPAIKKPFLTIGIVLLITTLIVILIGLCVPLFGDIVVKPGFFNTALMPIAIGLAVCIVMHVLLPQSTMSSAIMVCALIGFAFIYYVCKNYRFDHLVIAVCGGMCIGSMLPIVFQKTKMALGHIAFGALLIGFAGYAESPVESTLVLHRNAPKVFDGITFEWTDIVKNQSEFMNEHVAQIRVIFNGSSKAALEECVMRPRRLYFHNTKQQRAKASLITHNADILMVTTFEESDHGALYVTLHHTHGMFWLAFAIAVILLLFFHAQIKRYGGICVEKIKRSFF